MKNQGVARRKETLFIPGSLGVVFDSLSSFGSCCEMPGLVAFDRRWHIGSDDLFFPAAIGLVIRFCWYVIFKGSESLTFATLFSVC